MNHMVTQMDWVVASACYLGCHGRLSEFLLCPSRSTKWA
jgi:hypothetical protein